MNPTRTTRSTRRIAMARYAVCRRWRRTEVAMPPYDDDNLERTISITHGRLNLEGTLGIPRAATGIVLFAHGSGSSRLSPRNRFVARAFRDAGYGRLLLHLLWLSGEYVA